jgi:hypothetical protein
MTGRTLAICLALIASVVGTAQPASVRVVGPQSFTASAADLAGMPRTQLTTRMRDQQVIYEGVSVR